LRILIEYIVLRPIGIFDFGPQDLLERKPADGELVEKKLVVCPDVHLDFPHEIIGVFERERCGIAAEQVHVTAAGKSAFW
jgi:hypothetical protein